MDIRRERRETSEHLTFVCWSSLVMFFTLLSALIAMRWPKWKTMWNNFFLCQSFIKWRDWFHPEKGVSMSQVGSGVQKFNTFSLFISFFIPLHSLFIHLLFPLKSTRSESGACSLEVDFSFHQSSSSVISHLSCLSLNSNQQKKPSFLMFIFLLEFYLFSYSNSLCFDGLLQSLVSCV